MDIPTNNKIIDDTYTINSFMMKTNGKSITNLCIGYTNLLNIGMYILSTVKWQ